MDKIKILIVEDHFLTRMGLVCTLEKFENIEILGEVEDGKAAVAKAIELKPDVILMDLGLPKLNGIEATKEIRAKDPEVGIVILTSHNEEDEILASFSSGADAYCLKNIAPEMLVNAINSVHEGAIWIDPAIAEIILNYIPSSSPKPSTVTIEEFNLTPREIEVLKYITEGLSNADIAFKLSISMHTTKSHISSILSKLGVTDRTKAAVKAMKENLI